jgi:hypothetical protein
LEVYRRTGDMNAVVDFLIEDTVREVAQTGATPQ